MKAAHDLEVSLSTVARFVRQIGYRYKKTVTASEQHCDDVALSRENWKAWQSYCDASRLVFLDETSMSTAMARHYGRALGGARCRDSAPGGHWKTLTFIAGLRLNQLTAPWCLDQAMTGEEL
ncbi:hypothetical protein [Methylobacter sp.]|uniref:hypothetical protein n=1 Tax=Methylobacter sp. TaxID=2051955 RepID=UPI003DA5AA2F